MSSLAIVVIELKSSLFTPGSSEKGLVEEKKTLGGDRCFACLVRGSLL